VSGQEIMTADKVSLRMNALVTYRIADARKAVSSTDDVRPTLYCETQLALRAVVGARELDMFLTDKDAVAQEIEQAVRRRAGDWGLEIVSVGIRDVILPSDMKELMHKVTEAKKAAEANLISRREETAAMRSQANTAKLLADNPTLMRLRELEVKDLHQVVNAPTGHATLHVDDRVSSLGVSEGTEGSREETPVCPAPPYGRHSEQRSAWPSSLSRPSARPQASDHLGLRSQTA
jgi:hypothetical protein